MVTIVVEDGTGLPTANAFVSVSDADDILAPNIHSLWPSQTEENKEKLIIWATRLIIQHGRWKGKRVSDTSGTPFPRSGLKNSDGVFYPDDDVPEPVKVATSILADFLSAGDPTQPNAQANLKRLDVDVISIQYDTGTAPEKWPPDIGTILRDIGYIAFGKTGGKPIIKH